LVFIKRGVVIEADKNIAHQLRVLSLNDGSPYETLHSYISTAVSPFFKSYVKESGRVDKWNSRKNQYLLFETSNFLCFSFRDSDKVAPSVEKKLAELELGLLHLQQNIDIPDISLTAHPIIQQLMKRALEENRRPKIGDLGDRVEDSSFLNQLQSGVNRWIRDMQKVIYKKFCKLYLYAIRIC